MQLIVVKVLRKVCQNFVFILGLVVFPFGMLVAPIMGIAQQEDTKPKFGRPPAPDAQKRIDVFIEPKPKSAPQAISKADPDPMPSAPPAQQDWFWGEIPAQNRGTNFGSDFERAISLVISDAPDGYIPTADDMQRMIATWNGPILMGGALHNVSPALIASVIWVESHGKAQAVSSAGAQGLMQLIPATAERFGVTDPLDPSQNIAGGAQYLSWLINRFSGDPILALAGYNAGENAVLGANGVPDYPETRAYVPKVLAAYAIARLYCKEPPVYVTDGCVFQLPLGE